MGLVHSVPEPADHALDDVGVVSMVMAMLAWPRSS